MPRILVLLAAVCFGTTGTAQALGPDAAPVTVGAVRIAIGGALLLLVARAVPRAAAAWPRRGVAIIAGALAAHQFGFFAAVHPTRLAGGAGGGARPPPPVAGLTAPAGRRG